MSFLSEFGMLNRMREIFGPQSGIISANLGSPGAEEPQTFYVDPTSGEGSDTNDGRDPRRPKATLQGGIDACTANRGDTVIVLRGGETVTSQVNFNKSGIIVRGVDNGVNPLVRGEYNGILADASLTDVPVAVVSAPCKIEGLAFVSRDSRTDFYNGAALLIGGTADANPFGVHIKGCRFPKWNVANTKGISIEGSTDVLIEDCTFEGVGADLTAGIYVQGATQNLVIRNNYFRQCTTAVLTGAFAGGGPHMFLHDNKVEDGKLLDTGGNTGTGLISHNYLETATDTASYDRAVATLQGDGWQFSGNHYSE